MALVITISAGTKRPHPTEQYGSLQATVSIQGEAGSIAEVPAVMRDLFRVAQAGVDEQLAQQIGAIASPSQARTGVNPTPPAQSATGYAPRPSQGHPAPARSRRAAPVTDSQRRLIDKLLQDTGISPNAILQQYQVQALTDLTCKDASELIDDLKQRVPR